ncbi:MAG: hypothetical protein IJH37_07120 [Clostridia bacterium]|nr:hypothetical protein [Clostridia bacterium]
MRNSVKRMSAFVVSLAFAVTMPFAVSAASITARYDKEADSGKATLSGVETTGRSQTMIVLSDDFSSVALDKIVWLYQKDDGTVFDSFYVPNGTYADLDEGETVTYYVRIGGSDGTIQTTELTIAKEVTATPTPIPTSEPVPEETAEATATPTIEPTEQPTTAPSVFDEWITNIKDAYIINVDWNNLRITNNPSAEPTAEPAETPTVTEVPTEEPTAEPTAIPTVEPTAIPTMEPIPIPTAPPTIEPTEHPTTAPSAFDEWIANIRDAYIISVDWNNLRIINNSTPEPTAEPTEMPTATPTPESTATPAPEATATPTPESTATPAPEATAAPTPEPTATPTPEATVTPTLEPTDQPVQTEVPTDKPLKPEYRLDAETDTGAINAYVSNPTQEDLSFIVIAAQYSEDGILLGVKAETFTAPAGMDEPSSYSVILDKVHEKLSILKGFIWDSMDRMEPLAAVMKRNK